MGRSNAKEVEKCENWVATLISPKSAPHGCDGYLFELMYDLAIPTEQRPMVLGALALASSTRKMFQNISRC
jgi:hypothetical protein